MLELIIQVWVISAVLSVIIAMWGEWYTLKESIWWPFFGLLVVLSFVFGPFMLASIVELK